MHIIVVNDFYDFGCWSKYKPIIKLGVMALVCFLMHVTSLVVAII